MKLLKSLMQKWKIDSLTRIVLILLVFTCTGFTILFLKDPLLSLIDLGENQRLVSILYYIFIWPIYNVVLLIYGFLFGQFSFFWAFEKRLYFRLTGQKHRIESE